MSNNLPEHGPNPGSFSELAIREQVTGPEVLACYEAHVQEHLPFAATELIGVAKRTSLTPLQYRLLAGMAYHGIYNPSPEDELTILLGGLPATMAQHMGVLGFARFHLLQSAIRS